MIPLVVASERGTAQTRVVATHRGGCRTTPWYAECEEKHLESCTIAGESPLSEALSSLVVS